MNSLGRQPQDGGPNPTLPPRRGGTQPCRKKLSERQRSRGAVLHREPGESSPEDPLRGGAGRVATEARDRVRSGVPVGLRAGAICRPFGACMKVVGARVPGAGTPGYSAACLFEAGSWRDGGFEEIRTDEEMDRAGSLRRRDPTAEMYIRG